MKLTPEQLAAIIVKVFSNLVAAGKDPANVTTEEIVAELEAIINEGGEPTEEDTPPAEEPPAEDEGKGDGESAITPDFINQVLDALKACQKSGDEPSAQAAAGEPTGQKSAEPAAPQQKSGGPGMSRPAQPQRKYAGIFLSTPPARSTQQGSNFKSRIASMSERDRRKATFGAFGRAVKCIHASGGDLERAAYAADHKFQDSEMSREFKALSATSPTDGGYLVPEVYANEIIELLYPATAIYELGARRLGMANGNMNLPKIKTGARAMFTGENRQIPKTAPKFGNLKLSAKKLTALIPMSNDLLRSTNFDNDSV